MPRYDYKCPGCGMVEEVYHSFSYDGATLCGVCETPMDKQICIPAVHGTRDSFGVGKSFVDPDSGKEITTWKEWEQAGYKPAAEAMKQSKRGEKAQTLFKEKLAKKQNHKIQV